MASQGKSDSAMMPNQQGQPIPVGMTELRQKLNAVTRYIEANELAITQFSRLMEIDHILRLQQDPGEQALLLRDECANLWVKLDPETFIKEELKQARAGADLKIAKDRFGAAMERLISLMQNSPSQDELIAGLSQCTKDIQEGMNAALEPARALHARLVKALDRPAAEPASTVKDIAKRFDVDEGTVRKWCKKPGEPLHGCHKIGDVWRIPKSAEQHFPWPLRPAASVPKEPEKGYEVRIWRCATCGREVLSVEQPERCSTCITPSFYLPQKRRDIPSK